MDLETEETPTFLEAGALVSRQLQEYVGGSPLEGRVLL